MLSKKKDKYLYHVILILGGLIVKLCLNLVLIDTPTINTN